MRRLHPGDACGEAPSWAATIAGPTGCRISLQLCGDSGTTVRDKTHTVLQLIEQIIDFVAQNGMAAARLACTHARNAVGQIGEIESKVRIYQGFLQLRRKG